MSMRTDAGFLCRNLDVFLGLLAWVVAATYYVLPVQWGLPIILLLAGLVAPAAWLVLTTWALRLRRRPAWRLWWMWPSAPMAFSCLYLWGGLLLAGKVAP